jgi:hypothetical protein
MTDCPECAARGHVYRTGCKRCLARMIARHPPTIAAAHGEKLRHIMSKTEHTELLALVASERRQDRNAQTA